MEALAEAFARYGRSLIFNTEQGAQFTSAVFTGVLKDNEVTISRDGCGRWLDNVMVERLWRTVKYGDIYLRAYDRPATLRRGLDRHFSFYDARRGHSALGNQTRDSVYFGHLTVPRAV